MKKILLVVIISFVSTLSFAQQNKSDKERMVQIRTAYAAAVENARITCLPEDQSDYVPKNYVKTTILHNMAGTGQGTETLEFFFDDDFDENEGRYVSNLRFVRRTIIYTIAELKEYEEYLFDTDGKPMFYFSSSHEYVDDKDLLVKLRSYYRNGEIFNMIFKSGEDASSLKQSDIADEYMHLPASGTNGFYRYKDIFAGLLNCHEN